MSSKTYHFDFENVDKQYDSYNGINVKLRYFLRVTIARQYSPNIVQELDLWVKNVNQAPVIPLLLIISSLCLGPLTLCIHTLLPTLVCVQSSHPR